MSNVLNTPIALDRDTFMRQLIASLGHLNEGILGSDIAGAYIMNVGLSMGAAIEAEYKRFWEIDRPFTIDEYAHVIVDLKQKIRGNFSLVSKSAEKVVVQTTSCPFDTLVQQSPSLCFMTSSVFGGIAARNFGYAKVALQRRIALGDTGCFVSVYLQRTAESETAIGREYTPTEDRASPDIAEQLRLMDRMRRLHRALGESTARWDEVVHGAAEAIVLVGTTGNVLFANARWRELLGFEGQELVNSTFLTIVHPADRGDIEGILGEVGTGQRIAGRECRLRHRDGEWRDAVLSAGPLRDDAGRITGSLLILRDVTQEREHQRLKDAFLTTASHELRTPVATIRALSQYMLRSLEKGSLTPDSMAQRLETIIRETDRLAVLGADLSDVGRLQTGRLALRRAPCDLREVVDDGVRQVATRLGTEMLERVRVRYPDEPIVVNVERARIVQVVGNLLDNALKYSPDGGSITITTTLDADHACLAIADRGIGIPGVDLPNLFTPFYRASNASDRHYNGLGIGLYLSKVIADAHGGDLTITSTEGLGTTVELRLPCRTSGTT